MSDDIQLALHSNASEAEQKFEYFMAGLIGAVCGYSAQHISFAKVGGNAGTLELLAILILAYSFYRTLRRIETGVLVKRYDAKVIQIIEETELLQKAQEAKKYPFRLRNLILGQEEMADKIAVNITEIQTISERIDAEGRVALSDYKARNLWLLVGFGLLLLSKVLAAYI